MLESSMFRILLYSIPHTPCYIPGSTYDGTTYWKIHLSKLLAVEFATYSDVNWMLFLSERKGKASTVIRIS